MNFILGNLKFCKMLPNKNFSDNKTFIGANVTYSTNIFSIYSGDLILSDFFLCLDIKKIIDGNN